MNTLYAVILIVVCAALGAWLAPEEPDPGAGLYHVSAAR